MGATPSNLNPLKKNAFRVNFPGGTGLNVMDWDQIASIQIPTITFDTAEHIEANHKVETPTIIDVQDFEIAIYIDQGAHRADGFLQFKSPYDPESGGLNAANDYKFDMDIVQYALDHATPFRRFELDGCWIKQRSYEQNERTSSDNQMVTYTIGVTRCIEVAI